LGLEVGDLLLLQADLEVEQLLVLLGEFLGVLSPVKELHDAVIPLAGLELSLVVLDEGGVKLGVDYDLVRLLELV